jgi:hypothetical protein
MNVIQEVRNYIQWISDQYKLANGFELYEAANKYMNIQKKLKQIVDDTIQEHLYDVFAKNNVYTDNNLIVGKILTGEVESLPGGNLEDLIDEYNILIKLTNYKFTIDEASNVILFCVALNNVDVTLKLVPPFMTAYDIRNYMLSASRIDWILFSSVFGERITTSKIGK